MQVLILHGLGDDISRARNTSVEHIMCFLKYAPENKYHLHDINQAAPKMLQEYPFDLILIDGTFLCYRWCKPDFLLHSIQEKYQWIAKHSAVKIAFPQDDYDHSMILDKWLDDLEVNLIYSICPNNHEILYPLCYKKREICIALTGYVDDDFVKQVESIGLKPLNLRATDIGYRARNLPPYFGSFGRIKFDLGDQIKKAAAQTNLRVDISMDEADTILGKNWNRFLEDCKFTLGCMSGSSINDKSGKVKALVERYMELFPTTDFEKIIREIIGDLDNVHTFSMLSPRVFEAATLGTCQVLVEGDYLPEMLPNIHYLELKKDFSNIGEILEKVRDLDNAQEIANRNYEAIISTNKYRYSQRVQEILSKVEFIKNNKSVNKQMTFSGEQNKNKTLISLEGIYLQSDIDDIEKSNADKESAKLFNLFYKKYNSLLLDLRIFFLITKSFFLK
jgi:hypothetical protein